MPPLIRGMLFGLLPSLCLWALIGCGVYAVLG